MKERVGASLPPAIDGAIEGEVDVTVSECRGTPEGLVLVLRWWGEGDGRPGVPFKGDSSASKCLFPVRVGERELGRYLRDMRALRFDAMVEGRVVGSLKVPLSRAPLRFSAEETTVVDSRYSCVAARAPAEDGVAKAAGRTLGSARVAVTVRSKEASRVLAALQPRGALAMSVDGGAGASKRGDARDLAARLVSAQPRFYRDPEARGEAVPTGATNTQPPRRPRGPAAATVRRSEPPGGVDDSADDNPWGAPSRDDPAEDVFEEGISAPGPPMAAAARLEHVLRKGGVLSERLQRAEFARVGPHGGVDAFLDDELRAMDAATGTRLADDADEAADAGEAYGGASQASPQPPRESYDGEGWRVSGLEGQGEEPSYTEGLIREATDEVADYTARQRSGYENDTLEPLLAIQRRAAALAAELESSALAHADEDLVEQLLHSEEIRGRPDEFSGRGDFGDGRAERSRRRDTDDAWDASSEDASSETRHLSEARQRVSEARHRAEEARQRADEAPEPPPPLGRTPQLEAAWLIGDESPDQIFIALHVSSATFETVLGSTTASARVAHRWSLSNAGKPAVQVACGPKYESRSRSRSKHRRDGSWVFGLDHRATAPVADAAYALRTATQLVEIWADADEGQNSSRLVGLAKVPLAALGLEFEKALRSNRQNVGAVLRSKYALTVEQLNLAVVDPRTSQRVATVRVACALGSKMQLTPQALRSACADRSATRLQARLRGTRAREQAPPPRRLRRGPQQVTHEPRHEPGHEPASGTQWGRSTAVQTSTTGLPGRRLVEDDSPRDDSMAVATRGGTRHVLELSCASECPLALRGHDDSGCFVSYALPSGTDADSQDFGDGRWTKKHVLWWDGDSCMLNSRAKHVVETRGQAVGGRRLEIEEEEDLAHAFAHSLLGGAESLDLIVTATKKQQTLAKATLRRSDVVDIALQAAAKFRDAPGGVFRKTIHLLDGRLGLRLSYSRAAAAPAAAFERRREDEVKMVPSKVTFQDETQFHDGGFHDGGLHDDERFHDARPDNARLDKKTRGRRWEICVGDVRRMGTLLRAWRANGVGSGAFPLDAAPHRDVRYVAEIVLVVTHAGGHETEHRSAPFEFCADDDGPDGGRCGGALTARFDAGDDVEAAQVRAGSHSAALDGPLGAVIGVGSGQVHRGKPVHGWWPLQLPDAPMADLKAAVHVSAGAVENDDYVDDDTRVVERVHDGAFSEARRLSSPRETVVRVGIESGRNMPSPPFGIQPSGGWSWHVDFGVVGAPASMRRRTPAKCCNGRFAAGFDVEWDASDAVTVSTRHLQSAALNFALFCGLVFVGDVTVDLSLLSAGFRRLDGEYRLADGRGREKGSLQVRIAVDESVTPPPINSADATAWPRPAHYEDAVLTAEAALRSAAALRPPPPVDAVQAAPVSMDAAPEAQPPDDVPDAFAAARLERAEARLFILAQRSLELDLAPDLGLGALRDMLASLDSVQQRLGSLGTAAPPGDQTCAPREDHAPRETSAPREAPAPPPAAVAAAPQRLDYDEVAAAPDSPGRPAKGASAAFASASPPVGAGVAVPAVAVVVVAPVAAPAVAPAAAAPDVAQLEALLEAERAAFRLQLSEEREALRRDKADFDAAQLAAREAAAAAETVAAAQQADREKLEVARDLRDDARRAAEAAASASLQLQEAARHRRDAQIEAERARETRRNDADRAAALAAAQSVQAADALLTARQEAAQAAFANRVTVDDSSSSSSTAPARAPARVASPPKGVSPPKRSQPFENQYQDFAAAETARIARIMRGALHVA